MIVYVNEHPQLKNYCISGNEILHHYRGQVRGVVAVRFLLLGGRAMVAQARRVSMCARGMRARDSHDTEIVFSVTQ